LEQLVKLLLDAGVDMKKAIAVLEGFVVRYQYEIQLE
jgi:hypothetical protein